MTRQLKNFNKNAFIEALNRVYWDDLLDVDDPTIMHGAVVDESVRGDTG